MTDKDKHKIKTLRKENDLLKRRLGDLRAEFKSIKNKMVEQNKSQSNVASVFPDVKDVQFVSDS